MKALSRHIPLLTSLLIILAAPPIGAQQIPAVYPVQGFLTDDEGQPIDGELDIRFRLYDDDGEQVFQEIAAVPISQGAFFYYLGTTEALDAELFSQFDTLELGVKVSSDSEMTPRMKVGSVPFAARAAFADRAVQADRAELADSATHAQSATLAERAELAGLAINATKADSATHAESADLATNATTALSATKADTATHALSADSATHADSATTIDGALTVYKVTNNNCVEPLNMLSFSEGCSPKQFDLSECPGCPYGPYLPGFKYRNCEGDCACSTFVFTPSCPNEPVGKLIPPN